MRKATSHETSGCCKELSQKGARREERKKKVTGTLLWFLILFIVCSLPRGLQHLGLGQAEVWSWEFKPGLAGVRRNSVT